MDWKQILSQSPDSMDDLQKDQIYEHLILLKKDKIDKKQYKKLFELSQHILKHKGEMVTQLLADLEQISIKDRFNEENVALLEETIELKKLLEVTELEKQKLKTRIKELNEEIAMIQRKPEASNFGSGEDSPDALSELDRQEELLNNISLKNKHIKQLLRDIEQLEKKSVNQSEHITELKTNLNEATGRLTLLTTQLAESKEKIKEQHQTIATLNTVNITLEQQIESLRKDNYDRELEIQNFGKQIEERALIWRKMLEEKDERMHLLRSKYDEIMEKLPGYDIDAERIELKQLAEGLKERDNLIMELETNLNAVTRELISSTDVINRLAKEREIVTPRRLSSEQTRTCCINTKQHLEKSTERCQDLQDAITKLEEDNIFKSKQAMEALETLSSYQSGEDGLAKTLKKNHELQHKLNSRDKQIRALIIELNTSKEVAQENCVLRKQLGIPDDENVSTKSFLAQQTKFEKINKRLTLKLRASEEMRLQLKLEKNDLRRRISQLADGKIEIDSDGLPLSISATEIKVCENCLKQYNPLAILQLCKSCTIQKECNFCVDCQKTFNIGVPLDASKFEAQIEEQEAKYAVVVEENENLRMGMHEILKKLREYDAESDHIVIDSTILEKLLHALDARSISGWYHPAMRMQNELIASKEREIALKEKVRITENILKDKSNIPFQQKPENGRTSKEDKSPQHIDEDTKDTKTDTMEYDFPLYFSQYLESRNKEIEELNVQLQNVAQQSRELDIKCEQLQVFKNRLDEVVNTLGTSEDEKEILLAKQYEEILKLQSELKINEKKVQFFDDDYRSIKVSSKKYKEESNLLIFELQKQLIDQNQNLKFYQKHKCPIVSKSFEIGNDEMITEIACLKMKLSQFSGIFLKHLPTVDQKNLPKIDVNKIEQYGVIENESLIHFITKKEYNALEYKCELIAMKNNELQIENKHLTELLDVYQNQIKTQQEMLSKTSEDEIALRHLVVDMQSTNNEKYIIAKQNREIKQTKESYELLLNENEKLQQEISKLRNQIENLRQEFSMQEDSLRNIIGSNELKLKFLAKSHSELRQNYSQFMPLYPIIDFVKDYTTILEFVRSLEHQIVAKQEKDHESELKQMLKYLKDHTDGNEIEDKIQLLKYQTQCKYLESQLSLFLNQIEDLKTMIDQQKLREINWTQHWSTIEMLFAENEQSKQGMTVHREVQTIIEYADKCVSTDSVEEPPPRELIPSTPKSAPTLRRPSSDDQRHETEIDFNAHKSMESQLKQAMSLASIRSALLLETENRLAIAQGRIKALERSVEEKDNLLKTERENLTKKDPPIKDDNILSITITSLQNLLSEKDNNLSKYQELLRGERQDRSKSYDDYRHEIKNLHSSIDDLEIKLKLKNREIESLQSKLKDFMDNTSEASKSPIRPEGLNEDFPDKYIEDMFLNERGVFDVDNEFELTELRNKLDDKENEIKILQTKLRDFSNREKIWEKNVLDKDREIVTVNQRFALCQQEFKDISGSSTNAREIEQLREMLEEKDRHINDLTETLTHFHDDQQRFINDTTIDSAEQVSQLSADLNRSEATNRILNTQIEALKRQIENLSQREKQARDLVKSFKVQLIKRPVISVKSERSTISREDHLHKRIHQLETDLIATKEELRKQTNLVQSRRAKDAAELALWDKQKRFQQLSENLKIKLSERESELDKLKAHFNTAKTTVSRLEREKAILEHRLRSTNRYCQSSSCPNVHGTKYTPAETPESYMSFMDRCDPGMSSEPEPANIGISSKHIDISDSNKSIIDALKARIESQQRKIIAMEFSGKSDNSMMVEFEKLQEKLANAEAHNLRLEAKNLQLQLDNDILKQLDKEERNQRQIKHLEDYIIALKNELSQALSKNALNTMTSDGSKPLPSNAKMEQTILTLRTVIEKLKVENKILKDNKKSGPGGSANITKDIYDKQRHEYEKLQETYSDALDKISALQIELEIQNTTCTKCKNAIPKDTLGLDGNAQTTDIQIELKSIKEKLIQKTQLLEKAKILLTRAAAKEKHFRAQIIYWKRRCSELQNVPVIDEASE